VGRRYGIKWPGGTVKNPFQISCAASYYGRGHNSSTLNTHGGGGGGGRQLLDLERPIDRSADLWPDFILTRLYNQDCRDSYQRRGTYREKEEPRYTQITFVKGTVSGDGFGF
jgi:hypothetical protein